MLTDTEIKKAIREATAERVLNDQAGGRGAGSLRLRIRPSDEGVTATWFAFWKTGGVRSTRTLGRYPGMTAAQARAAYHNEIVPQLLAGKNPAAPKAPCGRRATVGELFRAYVADLKTKGRASWPEVERALLHAKDNAADALGRNRLAGEIEAADVAGYLAKFYRRGSRSAADHQRAYVSAAFGWAVKAANDYTVDDRQDWGMKFNPAALVRRDYEAVQARDRNLSADELRVLWHAAAPGENGFTLETAAAIRLLIGTGQRVQEVLRLDGAELDLAAALWRMPREKTKLRLRPHVVPLPRQVLPVLADLAAAHGTGPLFPGRAGRERMDHRSVKQAIDRWLALPGVTAAQFQTRDLRRTWKSRTGEIGIGRDMRDLIQQHAGQDAGTVHYDRADYLPQMRAAMAKWEAWLDGVLA